MLKSPIEVAIIGGGGKRACDTYIPYSLSSLSGGEMGAEIPMRVAALVDPDSRNLEYAANMVGNGVRRFLNMNDFLNWSQHPRVIINATSDNMHLETTSKLLNSGLGYRVLLEKPLGRSLRESVELVELDTRSPDSYVEVFLEMRETLYRNIRQIVDSGTLGTINRVHHKENVGWYHFVHSYRRGKWASLEKAAHIVNAKMVHDWDILLWIFGFDGLESISSFAPQNEIIPQNSPSPGTQYCSDCNGGCRYDARYLYLDPSSPIFMNGMNLREAISRTDSDEEVQEHIDNRGRYSRCVYLCDKIFPERLKATFEYGRTSRYPDGLVIEAEMDGLSDRITRETVIQGSNGTLHSDMFTGRLYIERPDGTIEDYSVQAGGSHGGGDFPRIKDFLEGVLKGNGPTVPSSEALRGEVIGGMIIQGLGQEQPIYFQEFVRDRGLGLYF